MKVELKPPIFQQQEHQVPHQAKLNSPHEFTINLTINSTC